MNGETDDKAYLTSLYDQYYALLKKQAYNIVNNANIVDDLIHDAFIKLIPKISLLRSLNHYKRTSYVVYTLKHVCFDYIRKNKRRAKHYATQFSDDITEQLPDMQASTEETIIISEEIGAIEEIISHLSERDRNLLYFKYIMELRDKEIAKLMDLPANHVRQYAARARRRVMDKLSRGGDEAHGTRK